MLSYLYFQTHLCVYVCVCVVQVVNDYSEVEMVRKVGGDGMASEEYNFNSEVTLEHQVSLIIISL